MAFEKVSSLGSAVRIEFDFAANGTVRAIRVISTGAHHAVGKLIDATDAVLRRIEVTPGETVTVNLNAAERAAVKRVGADIEMPDGWGIGWTLLPLGLTPVVVP